MTTLATDTITVRLEGACQKPSCSGLAFQLRRKLDTPKYMRGVSLMPVPETLEDWQEEHRTARKRAARATGRGYTFSQVDLSKFSDDVHDINTSKQERQGRPMSDGYTTKRAQSSLPDYPCDRHRINTYGVMSGATLRAYLTLYRVGELALVSMILGHGDYLEDEIMYLLFAGVVADQAGQGGWCYYNRFDSGTDGLRFFKQRLGFAPATVEWML